MFVYIPPPQKQAAPLPIPTGDAVPNDVRAGKSFSAADGTEIFGVLPERSTGPLTVVPDRTTQVKTSGIYNGDITVQPIPEQTVDTSDATATADKILTGSSAYVKGQKVSGSMESQASKTVASMGTSILTGSRILLTPPKGYYDGVGQVSAASTALIASNIRKGIDLFGLVGTLNPSAFGKVVMSLNVGNTTLSSMTDISLVDIPGNASVCVFVPLGPFDFYAGSNGPMVSLKISDGINTIETLTNWDGTIYLVNLVIDKINKKLTARYTTSPSNPTYMSHEVDITRLDMSRSISVAFRYTTRSGSGTTYFYRAYCTAYYA